MGELVYNEEKKKKENGGEGGVGDESRWKYKIPVASDRPYVYDPEKMKAKILPIERKTGIYNMMEKVYDQMPMDIVDQRQYTRGEFSSQRLSGSSLNGVKR